MANFKVNVSANGVSYSSGDSSQSVTTAEITQAMKKARFADITANVLLIIGGAFLSALANNFRVPLLIFGLTVAALGAFTKFLALSKLPLQLEYNLDTFANTAHTQRVKAWGNFLSSAVVWEIVGTAAVTDQRNNSGASVAFSRISISRSGKVPFFLKTNTPIVYIKLKKERLFILPDVIIIQQGGNFSPVALSEILIKVYKERFIENGVIPSDAEIVEQTWQHVKKDGSPDLRYSENPELSVCLYGYLELSGSGLDVKLSCSKSSGIEGFTPDFQTAP